VKVNGAHLFIPRHPTIGCTTLSRVDHLAGLRVAAGRAPAACSVLSILVMWVTWWPHPCGPRGLNQIFRKPGIKYSETTEKKDSPPPFITRAKPVPPLDVGPRCPWAHRSPSLGRNGKHVSQTWHVERPMCDRVAVRRRLNHVARRYVGRGPRGSEETSLTSKCQLRGPS